MNKKYLGLLTDSAIRARKFSYSPYSKFAVGAALLTQNNKIYTGTNIECASYSLSICAERVVFSKAVSEGEKKFSAIAISSSKKIFTFPCGACRQFMYEFGKDLDVIIVRTKSEFIITKLTELLPGAFDKNILI